MTINENQPPYDRIDPVPTDMDLVNERFDKLEGLLAANEETLATVLAAWAEINAVVDALVDTLHDRAIDEDAVFAEKFAKNVRESQTQMLAVLGGLNGAGVANSDTISE